MKAILLAATIMTLGMPLTAPLQAATNTPAISFDSLWNLEVDRRGRGCDTAQDIAEHPRCTRA